jgi:hypothetical protein
MPGADSGALYIYMCAAGRIRSRHRGKECNRYGIVMYYALSAILILAALHY